MNGAPPGLFLRPAGLADARDIAALIAEVTAAGAGGPDGTPPDTVALRDWLATAPPRAARHVAETAAGRILGLQWIAPASDLPGDWAEIATFVAAGRQRLAIGSALLDRSRAAARARGFTVLHARVRADNDGALVYYRAQGFEPIATEAPPGPGARGVARLRLRHDL